MDVVVAMDGFTLPSRFIVKELCIMHTNGDFEYFLLKPPVDQQLSEVDKRTIRFTTAKLSNLAFHDGDIAYEYLFSILKKLRSCTVFTYSEIAMRCLQEILPTTIITNIQTLGFKMPSTLPDSACGRRHNPRYCAKSKAIAIKNFMNYGF